MRQRFCKHCRGWHSLEEEWPHNCRSEPNFNRADIPTPRLIRDGMDATWNPADGKLYDSKASYYAAVKAKGYEIAGNDSSIAAAHEKPEPPPKTAPGLKDALKQAWDANT